MSDTSVRLSHFSDVLCIWAYVSQIRLEELQSSLGGSLELEYRFVPVFGAAWERIQRSWGRGGGFEGYAEHVREIAVRFPHVELHPDVWSRVRPRSSATPHLFLKAVQLANGGRNGPLESMAWALRLAFFREGRDISSLQTLLAIADEEGHSIEAIREHLDSGTAMASLCRDVELRDDLKVEGSPTYILNQGRQKLYGNVGYRVLEANIQEILREPVGGASWC